MWLVPAGVPGRGDLSGGKTARAGGADSCRSSVRLRHRVVDAARHQGSLGWGYRIPQRPDRMLLPVLPDTAGPGLVPEPGDPARCVERRQGGVRPSRSRDRACRCKLGANGAQQRLSLHLPCCCRRSRQAPRQRWCSSIPEGKGYSQDLGGRNPPDDGIFFPPIRAGLIHGLGRWSAADVLPSAFCRHQDGAAASICGISAQSAMQGLPKAVRQRGAGASGPRGLPRSSLVRPRRLRLPDQVDRSSLIGGLERILLGAVARVGPGHRSRRITELGVQ
jgi:hypothetical protein